MAANRRFCSRHGTRLDPSQVPPCPACAEEARPAQPGPAPRPAPAAARATGSYRNRLAVLAGIALVAAIAVAGVALLPGGSRGSWEPVSAGQALEQVRRSKGQVAVLHVWATWCGPCRRELPELDDIIGELDGKGVRFVMVSVDQTSRPLTQFMTENDYAFRTLWVEPKPDENFLARIGELGAQFGGGIPYSAVFGKDGRVAQQWSGVKSGSEWRGLLHELAAG